MFRWDHKYSIEIDIPLHVAWNFFAVPSYWPLYDDRMEAFILDGDFKPGAQVKLKLKNKPNHIGILVTEYRGCDTQQEEGRLQAKSSIDLVARSIR